MVSAEAVKITWMGLAGWGAEAGGAKFPVSWQTKAV